MLILCSQRHSSKNREKGKYGRRSNDEIKDELLKLLVDGEIEFKAGLCMKLLRNNQVMKEYDKIIKRKKKGVLNLTDKQRLLFETFKEPDKFKEIIKETGVSKSSKNVRKIFKTQKILVVIKCYENHMKLIKQVCKEIGNELKQF